MTRSVPAVLLFWSVFPLPSCVLGQIATGLEVTFGPGIEHGQKFPSLQCELGSDENGYFVQREAPANEVSIERYGQDVKLEASSTFSPERDGAKLEPWYLFHMKGRVNALAPSVDRSSDMATFHVCALDPASMLPGGKWSTLGKVGSPGAPVFSPFTVAYRPSPSPDARRSPRSLPHRFPV